jgi:hypothetical protein
MAFNVVSLDIVSFLCERYRKRETIAVSTALSAASKETRGIHSVNNEFAR